MAVVLVETIAVQHKQKMVGLGGPFVTFQSESINSANCRSKHVAEWVQSHVDYGPPRVNRAMQLCSVYTTASHPTQQPYCSRLMLNTK